MYIYANISLDSFYYGKRLDKICKENQNTHFVCHKLFFLENRAVYAMMMMMMMMMMIIIIIIIIII